MDDDDDTPDGDDFRRAIRHPNEPPVYRDEVHEWKSHEKTPFRWRVGGRVNPPPNLSVNRTTKLKEDTEDRFMDPKVSLLAFIPIRVWKGICIYSNNYAHHCLKECKEKGKSLHIYGVAWKNDITLSEMMHFFGMLWNMVLRPSPGLTYDVAWKDDLWHPLYMPCQQIFGVSYCLKGEFVN